MHGFASRVKSVGLLLAGLSSLVGCALSTKPDVVATSVAVAPVVQPSRLVFEIHELSLGEVCPSPSLEVQGEAAKVIQAELLTLETGRRHEIKLHIGDTAGAGSYNGVLRISFPEGSGLAPKEIILNARIRQPR